MTQADVLKYLSKNKSKWVNSIELAKKLKKSRGSILNNCRILAKHKEIIRKVRKIRHGGDEYIFKAKWPKQMF